MACGTTLAYPACMDHSDSPPATVLALRPAPPVRQLLAYALLAGTSLAVAAPFGWLVARAALASGRSAAGVVVLTDGRWEPAAGEQSRFDAPGAVRVGWSVEGGSARWHGRREALPDGAVARDVATTPDHRIIAVGDGGVVLRRDAAGSWRVLRRIGPALRAIAVTLAGDVYAVGDRGALVRVTDTVTVLAGGGPDLTDVRVDGLTGRVFARTTPGQRGWAPAVGIAGAVALAGLGLLLLVVTAARFRVWYSARVIDRALAPAHVELIAASPPVLSWVLRARVLRATPAGDATVMLRCTAGDGASRQVVASPAVSVAPLAAGAALELRGPLATPADLAGEAVVQVAIRLGGHGRRLQGAVPAGTGVRPRAPATTSHG